MILEGFKVTTLSRTLIDLAGRLKLSALEAALDSATRRSFEVLPAIKAAIKRTCTRGRAGVGTLLDLVNRKEGRNATDSPLETQALQRLRDNGFPPPEVQWPVFGEDALPFIHVDLAYPRHLIAIVCNGLSTHGNRRQFDLDARQQSQLAGLGWSVIAVTSGTVSQEGWLTAVRRRLPEKSVHPRAKTRQTELW